MTDDQKRSRFELWYGMPIDDDMDILTEIAWNNWCVAWDAAVDCIAKSGNGYICVVRESLPSFGDWNKND